MKKKEKSSSRFNTDIKRTNLVGDYGTRFNEGIQRVGRESEILERSFLRSERSEVVYVEVESRLRKIGWWKHRVKISL